MDTYVEVQHGNRTQIQKPISQMKYFIRGVTYNRYEPFSTRFIDYCLQ